MGIEEFDTTGVLELYTRDLIDLYVDAALSHHDALMNGFPHDATAATETLACAYQGIRVRGREASEWLLLLLDQAHPAVRFWAATHALDFAPDRGVTALEELASTRDSKGRCGVLNHNSGAILKMWRRADLRFLEPWPGLPTF